MVRAKAKLKSFAFASIFVPQLQWTIVTLVTAQ